MTTSSPIRAVLDDRWEAAALDDDLFAIIDELTPWYREDDASEQWVDRTRSEIKSAAKDQMMELLAAALADAARHRLPTHEKRLRLDLTLAAAPPA